MDDLNLIKGQPYEVGTGTSSGLNLRREPTTNDKTKNGKNNVIVSLPNGTIVILESVEVHTSDGYKWYNVRPKDVDIDETGWVASNYLEEIFTPPPHPTLDPAPVASPGSAPVASPSSAPPPPAHTFTYDRTTYTITEPNLKSAKGTYIFDSKSKKGKWGEITIDSKKYWTTSENIKAMKDSSRKWIT